MRKGGGAEKGHAWERELGQLLSAWLTDGERKDIFSRNVLSGGAFTRATDKGQLSSRMPGDLMAAHPLAFAFLQRFAVEAKHLRDIGLLQYLQDPKQRTDLGVIISLARRQAKHAELDFMVVAKQNRYDAFVFIDSKVGIEMADCIKQRGHRLSLAPMMHHVHSGHVCILRLRDMISTIDPNKLLARKVDALNLR